jgi:ATP-binding cassette subfamily B (MDR/TAP) protein 1
MAQELSFWSQKCGDTESGNGEQKDGEYNSPWLSLFAFTAQKHAPVLRLAVILTIVAGSIKPTVAIFLGYLFDELANYGTENISENQVLIDVAKWCLFLAGLGFSAWFINGGYFALWLIFGDKQAKAVREELFSGLLERGTDWYDLRTDGIGSLLTRIQT